MAVRIPGTPDELLSAAEAAEVMGVSDAHVRRVIGSGGLRRSASALERG
ncbi:MAG: hypothetical protein IPG72_16220 [Ardenticatenales bacterium]|nr:hypothetical protein [Ardenticatenales bacterium]